MAGPPWKTVSAAVTVTTTSVSTNARLTRNGTVPAELDERVVRRVVHHDLSPEPPCELGRDEALELTPAGPASEAGGDEDRLVGRAARRRALVDRRLDRRLARIVQRAGDRQRRRLDNDRRPAARDFRLERLAGEREPQRVTDGRTHVLDGGARRGRTQHDTVRRRSPATRGCRRAAGRDSRQGIDRYRRRKVGRKPRLGQNRDAQRFVMRQSVTIVDTRRRTPN